MTADSADKAVREAAGLQAAARDMGLALPEATAAQLVRYLDLLARWNSTYNLTAVRDRAAMRTQHIVDCLAVVGPLRRAAEDGHLPGDDATTRLLDAGSGGGLPGVVVALLFPHWHVVCVDTVGKKAAFVRQVALELGLRNLGAEHARVENLVLPAFDVITSRAFASLLDFTALTRQLLAPRGVWLAMKGKTPMDEVAALPAEVAVFHVEQLAVPGLGAERCLVWMRKS